MNNSSLPLSVLFSPPQLLATTALDSGLPFWLPHMTENTWYLSEWAQLIITIGIIVVVEVVNGSKVPISIHLTESDEI